MNRRVLAIDDDAEATKILRLLLEKKGFQVLEENDSTRALETAREYQPDVVILDFLMPNVHGGDVAWQLASDPGLRGVKVIICSGIPQSEIVSQLPPARIPILAKPVDPEALIALIS
jgi:CheY-like chemotaxis protein